MSRIKYWPVFASQRLTYMLDYQIHWCSSVVCSQFVLDLFPVSGVNPLDGTNYLDTASAFLKAFLHLLAGEGFWGRGASFGVSESARSLISAFEHQALLLRPMHSNSTELIPMWKPDTIHP